MKKIIINTQVKNILGQIDCDSVIFSDNGYISVFKNVTIKNGLIAYLGKDLYQTLRCGAKKAFELKPFAELMFHEVLKEKHIGVCETREEALRIAQICNNTLKSHDEKDPTILIPETLEVSDEDFAIMQHLIETQTDVFPEIYLQRWNEMVAELNPEDDSDSSEDTK